MGNLPLSALPPIALDDLPLRDLQLGLVQEDLEHGVLVVADRIETAALDFSSLGRHESAGHTTKKTQNGLPLRLSPALADCSSSSLAHSEECRECVAFGLRPELAACCLNSL